MKKLGKLSISPGKIMKNEELINLQGGYDNGDLCVYASPCDGTCYIYAGDGRYFYGKCTINDNGWCECVKL